MTDGIRDLLDDIASRHADRVGRRATEPKADGLTAVTLAGADS